MALLQHNVTRSAERVPGAVAFRYLDQFLTYAELDRDSNQFAQLLSELGVRKGDRVGVMMDRTLQVAVAVYGILKSGAIFVPMDPVMPLERAADLMRRCEMDVIVSQASKLDLLEQAVQLLETSLVVVDCSNSEPASRAGRMRVVPMAGMKAMDEGMVSDKGQRAVDDAYIMFTSGSTGIPKGIVHTHESGQAYAGMSVNQYGITSEDVLGSHSPLHFDMSTMAYLSMPLVGACSVIIPDAHTRLPASMSQLIEEHGITIWYSVPFAIIQLISRGALEARKMDSLKWVLYGGEPFPPRHVRTLMDLIPGIQVSNVYGPAEVNQSTYFTVPDELSGTEESIPIGYPVGHAATLIFDDDGNETVHGEIGELLIRTPQMMRGYFRRSDLNELCFVDWKDTTSPDRSGRYYRTGDLASIGSDGLLYYHGRIDQQVKIRGNRVEIDELESLVMQDPAVEEAAAYAVGRGTDRERIEVSVLLAVDQDLDPAQLLSRISGEFPPFACPEEVVVLPEFPRTTSGKIDRRALLEIRNR